VSINHFYHIYAEGNWQEPVDEHINAVIDYGLRDSLNGFYVGIVGSQQNRNSVIEKLNQYDIDFSVVVEEDSGWEQVTMTKLHEFSKNNNGFIFYAHTKSAHDPSPINIAWRKSMCYFNVVKWEDAINHLREMNIDTVGCHWCKDSFWGGTYWWATTSYLSSLEPPLNDNRWNAEEWIGSGRPRIVDMNPGWPSFKGFVTQW
jgi:hypothetical protein